ncbi:MAG: rod shape-determining protein MreB, partial [Firmicutes bacterium]|nr:rod shape-determining protein MreB [Bacillota bacterium]
ERTAEEIKINIGTAWVTPDNRDRYMEVRGRDLVSGLPKTINISSQESWIALEEPVYSVIDAVKKVLEVTPPELAADIVDNGIVMTGGGSLLDGFATLLSVETNLPVHVAEDAISCVAMGTGKALNEIHILSKNGRGPKRLV